ncbi:hypothetical protein Tsubulata_000823 [Turnera subulata]|uniref:TF-B3 domain-containing protein n=1 Tax=Turnera subulata TaxID=218843 RepID=A0A9Q0GCX8_9ROSI|nr:hypothetical protein Tsubulata_000823 [Turnera subulata]
MNSCPDNDLLSFQQRTPLFFKIAVGDTIQNGKLMIPPRFTRKYGKGLPKQVILNVPTSATWTVCFLEESSDAGSKPKNKQKRSKAESARRIQPMLVVEKARALSRASAFRSTNPFFQILMQPSFVHDGYKLAVPSGFAKEHFPRSLVTNGIILSLSDSGRTWRANYYPNIERGRKRVRYFGGWKEFVVDNNLVVGDVCVFELINEKYMMFRVFIYRLIDEDVNCPLPVGEYKSY